MWRSFMSAIVVVIASAGFVAFGQKLTTAEELDQAMKTIGASLRGVDKGISSAAYVDAKVQLALARQTLASTATFWRAKNKEDAVRMAREAIAKLDALDVVLSASVVDAAAATAAVKEANSACAACHSTYREGDPQTGYRLKPGSL